MKVLLSVVYAILLAASVQGCGFLDLKCKAKDAIEEAGSQLIGQAKQAFEQAMDYVFDNDIVPLLDKVEAAIDAGIDKVNQDVNETIDHVESAIEAIIQDAAKTANALATNLTHDIEQIISQAASAAEQVEQKFYRDASNLLEKINQIVEKGQCLEAAFVKQLQDGIYRLLKSLNPYYRFSSCWRSLGFKATMTLEDLTTIELYNYQKECTLLNKITPTTPIKGPGGLLETYAQGQLDAAEYYCIGETANAPALQDVMTKEWVWWGVQYNAWLNIISSEKNSYRHTAKSARGYKLQDNSSCGTPVECYAKAIEDLKLAEQKISGIQFGLSQLNQTVIANQEQLMASISANVHSIKANTNASANNKNSLTTLMVNVSLNTKATDDNKNMITANKMAISTVTVSLCNCTTSKNFICPTNTVLCEYVQCCHLCVTSTDDAGKLLYIEIKKLSKL